MSDFEKAPFSQWDQLLAKYVRVWIWTALFVATSGLTYSYVDVRFDARWGTLVMLPLALFAFGVFATLGAWVALLRYLQYAIIPEFFMTRPLASSSKASTSNEDATSNEDEYHEWRTRRAVLQAYRFLILAGLSRLGMVMSYLAFELTRRSGSTGSF
jgi:hypothetical protein